jgi:hypothetical protein
VMNAVPRNREAMVKTLERLDAEAVRRASA